MTKKDDEKNKKANSENELTGNKDEDKYFVEEEKIRTVFGRENEKNITVVDDDEEVAPQNKNDYVVQSQLISEEKDGLKPIPVADEMRRSFLEYAMSVIVSRALPDAADGLKPVHRRILYGMHELGLSASVPHKKSARIVGDVLGKYHPHGDSAVYEAMVRMAQDFSMRYPLIDGHGNFGSVDGDAAAAMRYTEARMSKIAALMVDGIKKNTIDFVPNYDGSDEEPKVLPARIPNLLVSGATGIAVGMATSIPPHNITEVINGVIALAQNPDLTNEDLAKLVQGPDFPTGGIILGVSGIREAYNTGRGSIVVRARATIETLKNGRHRIIVTEIPYLLNKADLIEKIARLVKEKTIEGITDLRDETSRKGMRIIVECKKDVIPEVLLNKLFKLTPLQSNFAVNMIALVNGEPKLLDLKTALDVYLKHQIVVVTRRTKFDLEKAEARTHILEGLKIAIQNIDEVIKIIRSSRADNDAISTLMKRFSLSTEQAKSIVDMRLGRLTGLAIEKMNEELALLADEIQKYRTILGSHVELINTIIAELTEIKNTFGDARRTEISVSDSLISDEDLIPQKDVVITMSMRGYVKRLPLEEYDTQHRGGVGSRSMTTYEDDDIAKIMVANTHSDLLVFTSTGKVYRLRVHQLPEMGKQSKGIPFINLLPIEKDEQVIALLTVKKYVAGEYLLTVTKNGVIKKTPIMEYERINRNGKIALGMREGDSLVRALIVRDNEEIIIGSSQGDVVHFAIDGVRALGRSAAGVRGIKLPQGKAEVVGAATTNDGQFVLSIGRDGFGKKTALEEYRLTNRGAKGVKSLNVNKAGALCSVAIVKGNEDILVVTKEGITIRTSLAQVATSSRSTKGVKIITLKEGNSIRSITIINFSDIDSQVEETIRNTQELSLKTLNEKEKTLEQEDN